MKKNILVSIVIGILFLIVCFSNHQKTNNHTMNDYYEDGYADGYAEGIEYILSELQESSYNGNIYMNIEDVEDSIRIYFDDYSYLDIDEIRDGIIYHPDFEHFTIEDWVEEFVDNYKE